MKPHYEKLKAALSNPKCSEKDRYLLNEATKLYDEWATKTKSLIGKGKERVKQMVDLLNWYKDEVEVNSVIKGESEFLRRQRGQLKLESSILEEFLIHLIHPDIIPGIGDITKVAIGPARTFMSLSFIPPALGDQTPRARPIKPLIKDKDMDFLVGKEVFYRFSVDPQFLLKQAVAEGSFIISLIAAECKTNLD